MLLNWLFRLLIPHFESLITNPATGKASQKSLFGVVGFVVGIGGAVVAIGADLWEKRPVDNTTILLLLGNGLGLSALKVFQQQANRQTATSEGQPLTVPNPPGYTPPVMPQVPNPNLPYPDPVIAGYNDGAGSTLATRHAAAE